MTQITIEQAMQLGVRHHQAGRLEEAERIYRQILAREPGNAQALHLLGVLAGQVGRHETAKELIGRAIKIKPGDGAFHSNLGDLYRREGRLDDAIAAYRKALALNPDLAIAHNNLGNALRAKGQLEDAVAAYHRALALNPKLVAAHNNLGIALQSNGRLGEAIAACRRALALDPSSVEAYNTLGNALQANGQLDEAVAAFGNALTLNPGLAEAHNNLGYAFQARGQLDEAITSFQRALELKPDYMAAGSNRIYTMHLHPGYDAKALLREAMEWDRQYGLPLRKFIGTYTNDPSPDRRLRIGYVSPDFREHPIGRCYIPLFAHHDRQQFEIICYSDVVRKDAITQRLQGYSDQWHDVAGLSHSQLAEKIRGDGIDLLVDGTGHTGLNRLLVFARKPAPVQITWLGYPGSTGMSGMDYRLTDPYLDPPGQGDEFYSEKSIRLPRCCWCFEPIDVMPPINALPAPGAGHVTFGCFNNFAKINAGALQLWIGILSALPASRLILQCPLGSHRDGVRQMFQNAGIDPHRLELVAKTPSKLEYFEQYHKVDLCLDPMPYNGHTTNFDALWMGVPVVTLCGKTAVGRAGASVLSNLDLREFIGLTSDEYVSIAVKMGSDLSNLSQLRETMRQRMQTSPVMDGKRYAADVEAAYRGMWRNWKASECRK